MTMTRDDEALEYCRTLLAHFPDKLSEWEDTFVRGLQILLERGGTVTSKQADVLDRLMERCARQYGRRR